MESRKYLIYIILTLFIFISCQKVIDVDLNTVDPKIVVQASISNEPGVDTLWLNQSVNFDELNEFPGVKGASVIISDDLGNSETLLEKSDGIYLRTSLIGIPGRTYTLSINLSGKEYKASCKMPMPVEIDSVKIEKSESFFRERNSRDLNIYLKDPQGTDNFYRVRQIYNNEKVLNLSIFDDKIRDGKTIKNSVRHAGTATNNSNGNNNNPDNNTNDQKYNLNPKDTIEIILQSIDKPVYDYFRVLRQIGSNRGGGNTASPANPTTNLSNGALGYFSAYAATRKKFVVP